MLWVIFTCMCVCCVPYAGCVSYAGCVLYAGCVPYAGRGTKIFADCSN